MLVSAWLTIGLWLLAANPDAPLVAVPDPQAALKPETAEQRIARHAHVAEARSGPVVVVHRGAWEYAPENTLSALHAAFELGAKGVELDFRRTADGVIVLSHDDRLERLLDGVGRIQECCYEELLLYTFNLLPAPAADTERVPTLRDVLQMVREHAGLLHLDIKDPGIDAALLEELQTADMLDHVVTYNDYNSEAFHKAGIARLPFRGSLMDNGRDIDPGEAQSVLKRPGNLVILDDPRAMLTVLGRTPVRISPKASVPVSPPSPPSLAPLEAVLRGTSRQMPVRVAAVRFAVHAPRRFAEVAGELCRQPSAESRRAVAWNLGMLAKHRPSLVSATVRPALVQLLHDPETTVRAEAGVACGRAGIAAAVPTLVKLLADRPADLDHWTEDQNRLSEKRTLIEARARYAFALGLMGVTSPAVTEVLVDAVNHRAVHQDLMLVGVDGAMAAWALGRLRAADAVGALRSALFRDDRTLAALARPEKPSDKPAYPPGSLDFHIRTFILPALAEIGTDDAFAVLDAVINSLASGTGSLPPYLRARAAEALANSRGRDSVSILSRLSVHQAPEVRRSAILACLRQSDPRYRTLLESGAPWAVPWWDVQHRPVVLHGTGRSGQQSSGDRAK